MDPFTLILLLLVIGAVGWFVYTRARTGGSILPARPGKQLEPTPPAGIELSPNLGAIKKGDAISFIDGSDATVVGSLDCRESIGGRTTDWRWVFLSGDRVLELLPQGQNLYDASALAQQGDAFYELLVGAGGALKRFEGNVREGIAHEPVLVNIDDVDYRIRSTGTFAATRAGDIPAANADVWGSVSSNAADNVYFKMVPVDAQDADVVALGVWTTHILVLTGRSLSRGEIRDVFHV